MSASLRHWQTGSDSGTQNHGPLEGSRVIEEGESTKGVEPVFLWNGVGLFFVAVREGDEDEMVIQEAEEVSKTGERSARLHPTRRLSFCQEARQLP